MKTFKATAAVVMTLLLGAGPAFADGSAGAEPFNFLFLDANARAVAMGGAYTALATDANALLYNPAGLGRIERNEATFMHNSYAAGIFQEYGAYASPTGWGANFNYLNSGSVANTTISNPGGAGLGSTGLYDLAFSGGYGRSFGDLSLGLEGKYIRESIAGISGTGMALDLGALYAVPPLPGLTLGAALQNVGPTVKFENAAQNLPLNLRGGAAYSFDAVGQKSTVSLDVGKERTSSPVVAVGLETVLVKVLPIRLGFTTNNNVGLGLTTGVGWIHKDFAFDYAFVPYGAIGNAQRVSVTWRWGEAKAAEADARDSDHRGTDNRGYDSMLGAAVLKPTDTVETLFAESDQLVKRRRYDDAEETLLRARRLFSEEDPRVVAYDDRLGRIDLLRGEITEAKGLFMESLREAQALGTPSPAVADAYWGLGQCLEKQDDGTHAIRAYKKALEVGVAPAAGKLIRERVKALEAAPQTSPASE